MSNTIRLKRSDVPNKSPETSDLVLGELAINTYDGVLFTLKDDGSGEIIKLSVPQGGTEGQVLTRTGDSFTWEDSQGSLSEISTFAPLVGDGKEESPVTIQDGTDDAQILVWRQNNETEEADWELDRFATGFVSTIVRGPGYDLPSEKIVVPAQSQYLVHDNLVIEPDGEIDLTRCGAELVVFSSLTPPQGGGGIAQIFTGDTLKGDGSEQNPLSLRNGTTSNQFLVWNGSSWILNATPSTPVIIEGTCTGSTIRKDLCNTVASCYGTISGGLCNSIAEGAIGAVISGGGLNTINGESPGAGGSSIGGGYSNSISGFYVNTISGGNNNSILACSSTSVIAGGCCNVINQSLSVVGGGNSNIALGCASVISGGEFNETKGSSSVISGGACNTTCTCYTVVAGGFCNSASCYNSTVSGGGNNLASGCRSTVSGGYRNCAFGGITTVSGGYCNTALNYSSTVSGGFCNTASGSYSTVSGGSFNCAFGNFSTVSGGSNNTASGFSSNVSGGCCNTASGCRSTVSGGAFNTASNYNSTVSGGYFNTASGCYSTVSGGYENTALGNYSTVSGGYGNTALGSSSTVSGGYGNRACSFASTVSGGRSNNASGCYSGILGGVSNNTCNCNNAFIVGSNICATRACTTFVNNLEIVNGGIFVDLANIPTSDPNVPGQVWLDVYDGYILRVSMG
jgi:hypothetical protein